MTGTGFSRIRWVHIIKFTQFDVIQPRSFRISESILNSAYIFFRRVFSASADHLMKENEILQSLDRAGYGPDCVNIPNVRSDIAS